MIFKRILAALAIAAAVPFAWQTAAGQQTSAATLIITNGIVVTVDGSRRVLNPGAVAINNNEIVGVDTPQAIAQRFKAATTIDATGKVVSPG